MRWLDRVFLAVDDLGTFAADPALVDPVARLDVLGHAELLHLAVGSGKAVERGRADDPLARLLAGRALGQPFFADLLIHLEAAAAFLAGARQRRVFVDRHAAILS